MPSPPAAQTLTTAVPAILGAAATAAYAATPDTQPFPGAPRPMLAALGEGPADEPVVAHMTAVLRHLRLQEDSLGPQVALDEHMRQLTA